MRYSGILLLALAIVIAVASLWIHSLWREKEVFTHKLDTSKVDYYLSGFSLYTTDGEGQNRFTIQGEHFVHQRSNKKSEIYKPTIRVNNNNDTLNLIADKAEQDSEGEIKLIGKVYLTKPETDETTGFLMQTSNLNYSPNKKRVETDAEVILKTTDGSIIKAIGMSEDLSTQTTRLKSNVHAEYTPASYAPDETTE